MSVLVAELTVATNHSGRNCCESADSLFWNSVKRRQFKFGHWREVRGKQEERIRRGSGCERHQLRVWPASGFQNWRGAETRACARRPWACQPVPAIHPPAQCSIVPHQPTHSFWRNATNFANIYSDWYCADICARYHMCQSKPGAVHTLTNCLLAYDMFQ